MNAEIVAIGTELTSGQKLDTNSQWLSLQLADLGITAKFHTTVADDLPAMVQVLRHAVQRADVVLITGGIGPTLDDLTRQAMADLAGVPLELDDASLAMIEGFFRARGREMPERNRIQAMFPAGSEPLANPVGTAPGIWMELPVATPKSVRATASAAPNVPTAAASPPVKAMPPTDERHRRCLLAAMPGVPSEMHKMYFEQVRPRLPGGSVVIRRVRINCFGLGESHTEQILEELTARGRNPEVGITASHATITLRIVAHAATEAECLEKIASDREEIHRRLGHYVFGEEDERLQDVLVRLLREQGRTLSTAESGTGGILAHWLTEVNDFDACYPGGVVVPTADGRRLALGLDETDGGISESTALEMAHRCRERFRTDYALAVTQYPRLDPERAMTEASVAYFALADAERVTAQEINLGGNPAILRTRTAKAALNMLRLRLLSESRISPTGEQGSVHG
jgi:nicotinamide-nucleotide amidase